MSTISEQQRQTRTVVGVDVGQRPESSAICVAEVEDRGEPESLQTHYLVRLLERLPAGTPYPGVADRVAAVVDGLARRSQTPEVLFLNATGRGEPLVELFGQRLRHAPAPNIVPVYLNNGDQLEHDFRVIRLGKPRMVTSLQTLLQTGRIHFPGGFKDLADQLLNFQIPSAGSDSDPPFRIGLRDDLVTALGLVTQKPWPRAEVW